MAGELSWRVELGVWGVSRIELEYLRFDVSLGNIPPPPFFFFFFFAMFVARRRAHQAIGMSMLFVAEALCAGESVLVETETPNIHLHKPFMPTNRTMALLVL